MAMQVGELSVSVTADIKGFSSSLGSIKSLGNSFSTNMSGGIKTALTGAFGSVGSVGVAAFGAISTAASSILDGLTAVGNSLTKNVTLPLGAATVAALKLGKDFESSLSKVVGLVGVASDQVDDWGNEILDLAPKLSIAPLELADALFFVTSAGMRGAEAMDVLEMSGKAAAAGLGETKVIADLVTSAMNAYGSENLSASQATDILVAAVKEGKAEASELASSMGQVLPIASEMGVSFDQVAAAQAAMTKTGTSASEASTQLKSILSGLLKPAGNAEDALFAMGTSSAELRKSIKEKGLIATLGDLRRLTNKYGEDAMAKVFPNIRALSGVLDLMGSNAADNIEVFDAVKESTGSLDAAFSAASDTLDFKWNQALAQVQSTALSFFEVLKASVLPILEKLTLVLDWVGEKFSGLSPKMQQFFVLFGLAAALLGPIILALVTVITTLGTVITGVLTLMGVWVGLSALLGPVFLVIIGAIGLLITTIGALVASFVYLWKTNEEFRTKVIETWEYIKEKGKEIFEALQEIISIVLIKIKSFWRRHGDEIVKVASMAWTIIFSLIKATINFIANLIKLTLAVIKGDWGKAFTIVQTMTKNAMNVVGMLLKAGMATAGALANAAVNKIIGYFVKLASQAKVKMSLLKGAVKLGIDATLSYIKGQYNLFKSAGKKMVTMIADGIKAAASTAITAMSSLTGSLRNFLPFSPAKEGPLKDLNKLNFYDSIAKSLENAKNKLNVPMTAVAETIANGLTPEVASNVGSSGTSTNNKNLNISAINIYGASNTYTMLQELKSTLKRYSGRLK